MTLILTADKDNWLNNHLSVDNNNIPVNPKNVIWIKINDKSEFLWYYKSDENKIKSILNGKTYINKR